MSGIEETSARLAGLMESLSGAETIEDLQRRFLGGVGDVLPGFGAGVYLLDPATGRVRAAEAVGVSDFFMGRYEDVGRVVDPVLQAVVDSSHAVHSDQLMAREAWGQTELYRGVLHLHRLRHLLQAPILVGDRVAGTLNVGRHDDEGAFTDGERSVADLLGRMLGVAVKALDAGASAGRERERALATLDLVDDAVVVSDLGTGERTPNAAARALLRRLEQSTVLDELIAYPEGVDPVDVRTVPATLAAQGAVQLEARTAALPGLPEVLVSFLTTTEVGARSDPAAGLAGVLTDRERDVADLAARGLHDREIAAQLFLSPHTVKQHLKAAYRKLGVRSRVDLARLEASRTPPPS